jgi:hypothetical protein
MKPIVPGAPPVPPTTPAAPTTVVTPVSPGNVPLKPVASTPALASEPNGKTGTSVIKSAPPKETARITVKPNLPPGAVRAGGNFPVAKAAAGAVPVVGAKPATTVVKTGTTKITAAAVKPTAARAVATGPVEFQEEQSTMLTTVLAAVLAVLTWGTAGILLASYYQLI